MMAPTSLLQRLLGRSTIAPHLRTGRLGERAASQYLRGHKYKILKRNLRTPVGEVDLLCLAPDRRTIVLVEVKTRSAAPGASGPAVAPELALNRAKRKKLLAIATDLIRRRGWAGRTVRIDLIAIDTDPNGEQQIRHHPNAVMLPGR